MPAVHAGDVHVPGLGAFLGDWRQRRGLLQFAEDAAGLAVAGDRAARTEIPQLLAQCLEFGLRASPR